METNTKHLKSFRIGNWLIRPDINRISGPKAPVSVGGRTMETLLFLVEHRGQPVTKEQLLENVWNDVIVTEDSIIKSISVLRQIFQLKGEEFPKIETVRGVGYMLSSPVEYVDSAIVEQGFSSKRNKYLTYSTITFATIVAVIGIFISSGYGPNKEYSRVIGVTNDWSQERVPRLSPNGHKVMFATGGEGWNHLDICIKDLATNKISKVTDDKFLKTDPIWSPDGKEIAFFRNEGKKVFLIAKNLSSQKERIITQARAIVNLSAMAWSKDGDWIVFCDYLENKWKSALFKINVHTGLKIRLTHPDGQIVGDLSPRISPNGKTLAFIRAETSSTMHYNLIPGKGKICIRDEVSSKITEIASIDNDLSGICWVDDEHIAYAKNHNNYTFRIYQINIHSGEESIILETENLVRNLDFHARSNKMVFESWNEHYGIWSYTTADQATNFSNRLIKSGKSNWQPKFHKKSNSIAYISMETGSVELWIRDSLNSEGMQITNFQGPIVRNANWSPDGSSLVFEANIDGKDDVYQVDIATKEISPLLTTTFEEKFPSWSEDGLHIYYSTDKTGQFEIWKKSLTGVEEDIQITFNGGLKAIENNGELYFTKAHSRGIWKISNEHEIQLVEKFSPNDVGNWDIAENNIYYIQRNRFWSPQLYIYNLTSGVSEHYQSFNMQVSFTFSGISFNPNSETLMVSHNDRNKSDIKMLYHEKPSNVAHSISFVLGL